jgi:hypothetical protein
LGVAEDREERQPVLAEDEDADQPGEDEREHELDRGAGDDRCRLGEGVRADPDVCRPGAVEGEREVGRL